MLSKKSFDAPFSFVLFAAYFHVPAAFFYMFGVHKDNSYLDLINFPNALLLQGVLFLGFIFSTIFGYKVFEKSGLGKSLFPSYNYPKSNLLLLIGILVLTIMGLGVAAIPITQTGSFIGAIDLVRHGKFYAGLTFVTQFIRFGGLLSVAFLIYLIQQKREGRHVSGLIKLVLLFVIINLMTGMVMGGKNYVIYPIAFGAIAYTIVSTTKPLAKLIVPAILIISLAVLLQIGRVTLVKGGSNNFFEYTYGGLGFDVMDLTILYNGSLDTVHKTDLAEDFYIGLLGVVPRSLWAGKPEEITAGGRFKKSISSEAQGAWPVFGYNQWYGNFGWIGIFAGGALTGLLLQAMEKAYGGNRNDPFSIIIMLTLLLVWLTPTGIQNTIFISYIMYVIPLFIFKTLTHTQWIKFTSEK